MNIILGEHAVENLRQRYIVLELDKFKIKGQSAAVPAYCVIETLPLNEMLEIEQYQSLHDKLIENYAKKNWTFCNQAIGHLKGRWNGALDSFYENLSGRINKYLEQDPGENWDGVLETMDSNS